MNKSKVKFTFLNTTTAVAIQFFNIFAKFFVQALFIRYLGIEYTGINGLFTNVLTLLSFAELGIGEAILVVLYKAVSGNDKENIAGLMRLYKKIYNYIGIFIAFAGLLLIPFLRFIIKDNHVPDIVPIYLLFLANTVSSYFFTYKRSLLFADQKDYQSKINMFIFQLIQYAVQIVILIVFRMYIPFLIVFIASTFLSNYFISRKVDRDYPYIKGYKNYKVPKEDIERIKSNTKEMIGAKAGSVILNGMDNILVSAFLGLSQVGIFSSYNLITVNIRTMLAGFISGATASIGNLAHESDDKTKIEDVLYKHLKISFIVVFFGAVYLMNLVNPFISIWIGPEFSLSLFTLSIIVINFALQLWRLTPLSFISALGTYQFNGVKSIIEALINAALSWILLKYTSMGIAGTVLGTLFVNMIINSWWEPFQIYRLFFKKSFKNYYILYLTRLSLIVLSVYGSMFLHTVIVFRSHYAQFAFGFFVASALFASITFIFSRNEVTLIFSMIKRLIDKSHSSA